MTDGHPFQKTTIGLIPSDWKLVEVGEHIGELTAGVSVRSTERDDAGIEGVACVLKTSAVYNGSLNIAERKPILPSDRDRAKTPLRANSIVISRMNTPALVGECGYCGVDAPEIYLPDRLWQARAKPSSAVSIRWLNYLIGSPWIAPRIKERATGTSGSMKNLAKGVFRSTEIPWPEPNEQAAIAQALSDIDDLLASLDALIAKKRDIKQGAMQQLLTGKRRLPGFSGHWQTRPVGSEIRMQVGCPFRSNYFNTRGDGIRLIRNRDLRGEDVPTFYSGEYEDRYLVERGEVLVGMDGDFSPCIWRHGTSVLNQRVGRLQHKQGRSTKFFYYLLVDPLADLGRTISGTTVKHLSHSDVEEIPCRFPIDPLEQQALGETLHTFDNEVEQLFVKREKLADLRLGMTQQLLTGRVRLA